MIFSCMACCRQHFVVQSAFCGSSSGFHASADSKNGAVNRRILSASAFTENTDRSRNLVKVKGRKSSENRQGSLDSSDHIGVAPSDGEVSQTRRRWRRSEAEKESEQEKRYFSVEPEGIQEDVSTDDVGEDIAVDALSRPSRGEIFLRSALERKAERDARVVHKTQKQGGVRRRDKSQQVPKPPDASCYGCGAGLQCMEPESPGFVSSDVFELKKKHHQLNDVICGRCRLLSQGRMIPAVGGHGGYGNGKGFVTAEQLRQQLSHIRNSKALIVKLVDIVDFNGSFLTRVRDLVGANPIILVATKVDLLPKGTDLGVVGDWIVESVLRKKLKVVSVHLTSAKALTGISGVAANIQRQRQGRDVYILGSANVGKSAFVSALLEEMSSRDPAALAARRRKPIQSAMPGTTLGPIEIKAFSSGGSLHDTPGVHLHHRMAAAVHPDDLPSIAPRRRLRGSVVIAPTIRQTGETAQFVSQECELENESGNGICPSSDEDTDAFFRKREVSFDNPGTLAGTSLFWGGLVRIDMVQAPLGARLKFFGPVSLKIIMVPTAEADDFYAEEVGKLLCPPSGLDKLDSWPGLQSQHTVFLTLEDGSRPAGDVAISGLGWVTVEYPNTEAFLPTTDDDRHLLEGTVEMVVHVPKAVEVYSRPPMPVGIRGPEWYRYTDVSDEELDSRPRFFY